MLLLRVVAGGGLKGSIAGITSECNGQRGQGI